MINPFDPVKVKFSSEDTIFYARPVQFIYDEKSEPVKAIEIVTTCPKCGALNQVDTSKEIIMEDTILDLVCKECGKPRDAVVVKPQPSLKQQLPIPERAPQQRKSEIEIVSNKLVKQESGIRGKSVDVDDSGFVSNNTFIDPVAMGMFDVEEI